MHIMKKVVKLDENIQLTLYFKPKIEYRYSKILRQQKKIDIDKRQTLMLMELTSSYLKNTPTIMKPKKKNENKNICHIVATK